MDEANSPSSDDVLEIKEVSCLPRLSTSPTQNLSSQTHPSDDTYILPNSLSDVSSENTFSGKLHLHHPYSITGKASSSSNNTDKSIIVDTSRASGSMSNLQPATAKSNKDGLLDKGIRSSSSMFSDSQNNDNDQQTQADNGIDDDITEEGLDGEDESKNRFNLRKRKAVFGSYEGYNDSDLSGDDLQDKGLNKKKKAYFYDTDTLIAASKAIKKTGCTIKAAGAEYGVPTSSLRRFYMSYLQGMIVKVSPKIYSCSTYLNGNSNNGSKASSPDVSDNEDSTAYPTSSNVPAGERRKSKSLAMTPLEEHQLVTYISLLSRSGKAISHADIKVLAHRILEAKDKVAFKNKDNTPTDGWIQKFKSRHPELDYKASGHFLTKTNLPTTKEDLLSWENDLKQYLNMDWKLDLKKFFVSENAKRIYTCDEIVIAFSKGENKADKVPNKSLLKNPNGEEKQLVTVIAASSAAGDYLKPYFLLPGDNLNTTTLFPTLDQSTYRHESSSAGLIDNDVFLKWAKYFDAYLTENNISRPVVLFLDDHQAHFHINVFLYCLDKKIIPVCLPPKLNKMLQPLLANFFPKLMVAYQACCKRYTSKTGNSITHDSFPYIMMKAWTLVSKSKFVTDGFSSCKLLPMDVTSHNCPFATEIKTNPPSDALPAGQTKDENSPSISDADSCSGFPPLKSELKGSPSANENKVIAKKRKLSQSSSVPPAQNGDKNSIILGDRFVSDERKVGRQEGINMCFSLLESFVPSDILPIWQQRSQDYSGTCELGFCMWQAVKLLKNGGIEKVGLEQHQQLQFGNGKTSSSQNES